MEEKMIELRRYSQKLMSAPDPPSARASAGDCSPKTRLKAPKLNSAGRRLAALAARALLVDSAVRRTQRNGRTETAIARTRRAQAPARRALKGRRRRVGAGVDARLVVVVMRDS